MGFGRLEGLVVTGTHWNSRCPEGLRENIKNIAATQLRKFLLKVVWFAAENPEGDRPARVLEMMTAVRRRPEFAAMRLRA